MNFNLNRANQDLAFAHPEEILSWAWHIFRGDVAASSSFQTQSVPLLKMIGTVAPQMTVFFLDTGFHFAETLAFKDRLVAECGIECAIAYSHRGACEISPTLWGVISARP